MTEDPGSLFAEAKVRHQAGNLEEAIALYSRAVALKTDYIEAHNNLGNALAQAKRYAEATASLRRATELRPDLAPIHANLGLALANQKLFEDAAASYRRAIELKSDFAEAHRGLGNVLRELGDFEKSIAAFRRAIQLKGDFAEAYIGLGHALSELKRFREAIAALRRATELKPDLAAAHGILGNALLELDRPEEAAASYRRALALEPGNARVYDSLGNALHNIDRNDEALESYDRALALDPAFAEAYNNRGVLLLELGRREEALQAFEAAIAAKPGFTTAQYNRLRAVADAPNDDELAALEASAQAGQDQEPGDRAGLHFVLGTAYEMRERYDEAFIEYLTANRLKRQTIDYSEEESRDRFERIKRVFSRRLLEERSGSGNQSELPIFIVGMPRSGSTLAEQILASHPQVHGGGERPIIDRLIAEIRIADGTEAIFPECVSGFRPEDFRLLGDAYAERLRALSPSALRITDKYLANIAHVGLIQLILPQAKIVHARRESVDACVSAFCLSFIGKSQGFTYDLAELGRYHRRYRDLMEHWTRVLPPGAMLDLSYESLVGDLEGQARRLLEFCGLAWDERCLDFHKAERSIKTASLGQVRKPIYRSSVGRWQRYRKHLGPLIEALGPYAPELANS